MDLRYTINYYYYYISDVEYVNLLENIFEEIGLLIVVV